MDLSNLNQLMVLNTVITSEEAGHASGNGKTAGKGHKGQKARSGAPRPGFEGGQMPLYRRLPKRGFTNRNSKDIVAINVSVLERSEDGAEVTIDALLASGAPLLKMVLRFLVVMENLQRN